MLHRKLQETLLFYRLCWALPKGSIKRGEISICQEYMEWVGTTSHNLERPWDYEPIRAYIRQLARAEKKCSFPQRRGWGWKRRRKMWETGKEEEKKEKEIGSEQRRNPAEGGRRNHKDERSSAEDTAPVFHACHLQVSPPLINFTSHELQPRFLHDEIFSSEEPNRDQSSSFTAWPWGELNSHHCWD